MGLATYQDFLVSVPRQGPYDVNALQLADYLGSHTDPDDRIFLWSDNVQVYYYADRLSPIDLIWPVNIQARGNFRSIFTPRTRYVIFEENMVSEKPDWLPDNFEQLYQYETTIGGAQLYKRIPEPEKLFRKDSLPTARLILASQID
jgi:hypothetical protein